MRGHGGVSGHDALHLGLVYGVGDASHGGLAHGVTGDEDNAAGCLGGDGPRHASLVGGDGADHGVVVPTGLLSWLSAAMGWLTPELWGGAGCWVGRDILIGLAGVRTVQAGLVGAAVGSLGVVLQQGWLEDILVLVDGMPGLALGCVGRGLVGGIPLQHVFGSPGVGVDAQAWLVSTHASFSVTGLVNCMGSELVAVGDLGEIFGALFAGPGDLADRGIDALLGLGAWLEDNLVVPVYALHLDVLGCVEAEQARYVGGSGGGVHIGTIDGQVSSGALDHVAGLGAGLPGADGRRDGLGGVALFGQRGLDGLGGVGMLGWALRLGLDGMVGGGVARDLDGAEGGRGVVGDGVDSLAGPAGGGGRSRVAASAVCCSRSSASWASPGHCSGPSRSSW